MISARPYSMRRQLLGLLLGAVAVIWIGVAVASYVDARHEIDELLDAHLAQASTLLIAQAGHDLDEIDEHVPETRRYARRVAFQFWEGGTRLRLRSSNAPHDRLSTHDEGFSDVRIDGQRWRVFSGWDSRHRYLVQVGERLDGARQALCFERAERLLEGRHVRRAVAVPLGGFRGGEAVDRGGLALPLCQFGGAGRSAVHLGEGDQAPGVVKDGDAEREALLRGDSEAPIADLCGGGIVEHRARRLRRGRRCAGEQQHGQRSAEAIKSHLRPLHRSGR